MRQAARILIVALLACGYGPRGDAAHRFHASHKFHASLSQMEYNAQTQSIEIIIRMFADDLENALTLRSGKRVRIDTTANIDALTLAYLREMFELKNGEGQAKTLAWVGKEVKVDSMWAYLEVKYARGFMAPRCATASSLIFDDQINRVNVKQASEKTDLVFKPAMASKPRSSNLNSPSHDSIHPVARSSKSAGATRERFILGSVSLLAQARLHKLRGACGTDRHHAPRPRRPPPLDFRRAIPARLNYCMLLPGPEAQQ